MSAVFTGSVTTPRGEIGYIRFGHGPRPFVLLPGMALHSLLPLGESLASAFRDFLADYTLYLFERGWGPGEAMSVESLTEDVASAMTALGIGRADVFGASQGGMLALTLCIAHPELVRAAVIGSSAAWPNPVSREVFSRWEELSRAGAVGELNRDIAEHVYSPAYRERYAGAFAAQENDGSPEELRRFALLARSAREFDCRPSLRHVRCPVLVLGAECDRVFSAAASAELAEALHCECYIYPGAAHAVYDEAEDYRGRLLHFFRALQ